MNNDSEKILEKVVVPTDKQARSSWRLRFDFKYYSRIKILKIASVSVVSIFILLVVLSGGNEQGLKIKKPEDAVLSDNLLARVAELMILPNERPFIATIVDYKPLSDNPFFKDANEGDKLLLFEGADKVVLFSPKFNKLVNVGTTKETGIKY